MCMSQITNVCEPFRTKCYVKIAAALDTLDTIDDRNVICEAIKQNESEVGNDLIVTEMISFQ